MEFKKNNEVSQLMFGGYTIGFVAGSITCLIDEISLPFQFNYSINSLFIILLILPILYWVYRYHASVFNNQSLLFKLLYAGIVLLGMFGGLLFFSISLNVV